MSTNVTYGRGEGIVTAIGMDTEIGKIARMLKETKTELTPLQKRLADLGKIMDTEIGKIARMLKETKTELTPLQKRLADLGKILGTVSVFLCILLFVLAVLQKRDIGEMLITAISLAVAAVPEGLPAIVTMVLALSVSRMVKVHTIVKRLPSVETLGCVSVVCSDKTGTLTQNRMTVTRCYTGDGMLAAESLDPVRDRLFLNGFVLCNDAVLGEEERRGDPTELALLDMAARCGIFKEQLEEKLPRVGELAFDSERKMMSTSHRGAKEQVAYTKGSPDEIMERCEQLEEKLPRVGELAFDSERKMMSTSHRGAKEQVAYTKGSPDEIMERCQAILVRGEKKPLTPSVKKQLKGALEEMTGKGLRVLALGMRENVTSLEESGLTFLGFAGMQDPVRPEAAQAVREFAQAQVTTVMITGDRTDTAFAIAKELGIASQPSECLSGEEVEQMDDEALACHMRKTRVFAHVSPEHKVRIVSACKKNGAITAMTGDGVNDAPSLKAADVGIAMGMAGTDVAKNAADIVLADDNFATIAKAIAQGRCIYENIRKSVIFLLSSNFGEIITMLAAMLLGLSSPLKSSHILWINLITDSLPALALGIDLLSSNFGEIITMLAAMLLGLSSPLKSSHILWINLITDSLPALALGIDVEENKSYMDRPPRHKNESLFANGGWSCTCFYGVLIGGISLLAFLQLPAAMLLANGEALTLEGVRRLLLDPQLLSRCQTYAFTVLGMAQLFHAVGMRDVETSLFCINHLENKLMILAAVIGMGLQLVVTEIPYFVSLFGTCRLSVLEWVKLLVLAAVPLAAHELLVFFSKISK